MAAMVRSTVAVVVAGVLALTACSKEEAPVSVPMDDVPVPPAPEQRESAVPAGTTAAPSAKVHTGPGHAPRPPGTAEPKSESIDSCCGALLDKANKSKDQASKKLYDQAAAICYRRAKAVREGKMSRAEALGQVRSSLLGPAPAACN
jgi:hypothetical protein